MAISNDNFRWLSEIDLKAALNMFRAHGVEEILCKELSSNDNSKNQVYLASDFSQLGKIPSGDIIACPSKSMKSGKQEAVFRADLDFYWINQSGEKIHAPNAKLIFYPQYPEVRFSGFLQGCREAPSFLWTKEYRGTEQGRILMLGVSNKKHLLGLTLPPESPAAKEIKASGSFDTYGLLRLIALSKPDSENSLSMLMKRLCDLHARGWINSVRLDGAGNMVPCRASNCGGYTLEATLGIKANAYSQPDFMGWEVKARQVPNADKPGVSTVTLFTPDPTIGLCPEIGLAEFIRRYGYSDTRGREDRLNIGGIYRAGANAHARTGLRMVLDGYDAETGKYRADGVICLLDEQERLAAGWPFAKLMDHWKKKHAHAAFVPTTANTGDKRQYRYGRSILLGEGAQFRFFLAAVHQGLIYYDPGIKLENISSRRPSTKRRSQFRVSSKHLPSLYETSRVVDACHEAGAEQIACPCRR